MKKIAQTISNLRISEDMFNIIFESEGIEGYNFEGNLVSSKNLMHNISPATIVEFLQCDSTKVQVFETTKGTYQLLAHNLISNESVMIKGLGDHFIALVKTLEEAQRRYLKRKENPEYPLLTDAIIKELNLTLQPYREGEVAIGEYRTVDLFGNPTEVKISGSDGDLHCVKIETSVDHNVVKKMKELLNWVNTEAFQNPDKIMDDIAQFHARFIKIHPFRDGNGRTDRLLTNYLLLINGHKMINIPEARRDEYMLCLDYANSTSEELFRCENANYERFDDQMISRQGKMTNENRYKPLAKFLESCKLENTNNLVAEIINYKSNTSRHFLAEQVDLSL